MTAKKLFRPYPCRCPCCRERRAVWWRFPVETLLWLLIFGTALWIMVQIVGAVAIYFISTRGPTWPN